MIRHRREPMTEAALYLRVTAWTFVAGLITFFAIGLG